MKKAKKLLGFTLIELLIVIAIIGVLAVAFLPTLLEAPAKGRDTSRIADLQKIQKVLVNANLEGKDYPSTNGVIADNLQTGYVAPAADWSGAFGTTFGGTLPDDPQEGKDYRYAKGVNGYSFILWAEMETDAGNTNCLAAAEGDIEEVQAPPEEGEPGEAQKSCYAIFTQ